jgi:hypothetical protein
MKMGFKGNLHALEPTLLIVGLLSTTTTCSPEKAVHSF